MPDWHKERCIYLRVVFFNFHLFCKDILSPASVAIRIETLTLEMKYNRSPVRTSRLVRRGGGGSHGREHCDGQETHKRAKRASRSDRTTDDMEAQQAHGPKKLACLERRSNEIPPGKNSPKRQNQKPDFGQDMIRSGRCRAIHSVPEHLGSNSMERAPASELHFHSMISHADGGCNLLGVLQRKVCSSGI